MCEYREDQRGQCERNFLVDGRWFSIKLDETFEFDTEISLLMIGDSASDALSMVIHSTSKYTMQTRTPILNAKLGKHYARLMHLSLIWLWPLIFVRKMILKVIESSGSICRRLQFYHHVSSSQLYFCLWYCLFKNNSQLISIDSLFPFKQTCPALGKQDLLLSWWWLWWWLLASVVGD